MDTAQKILVVYGTLSLGYGFALGIPLSQARMRSPEASRHLIITHLSAIIQGAVHLGLSLALGLSQLTAWLETASAACGEQRRAHHRHHRRHRGPGDRGLGMSATVGASYLASVPPMATVLTG